MKNPKGAPKKCREIAREGIGRAFAELEQIALEYAQRESVDISPGTLFRTWAEKNARKSQVD